MDKETNMEISTDTTMGTSRDMTREADRETEFYDSLLEDKLFDDVDFEAMDEQINQYISTQGPQPSIFSNMMSTEQQSIDRHQEDQYRRTIDTLKFEIERLRLDNASKDNKLRNLEQLQKNLEDITYDRDRLRRHLAVVKQNKMIDSQPLPEPANRKRTIVQTPEVESKRPTMTTTITTNPVITPVNDPPAVLPAVVIDSDEINDLYRILLGPQFQKMNIEQYQNKLQYTPSSIQERLRSFSKQFASQFVPLNINQKTKEDLEFYAADIAESLVHCESASLTIQQILNTLNVCLFIGKREKLFMLLRNASQVILILTAKFEDTAYHLWKAAKVDTSILNRLSQILDLYCFCDEPLMQAIQDHPDIEQKSYSEISTIADMYRTTPLQITEDLNKKRKPAFAEETVMNVLKTFLKVAQEADDTPILILLKQKGFIDLFSTDTPLYIIKACLVLVETLDMFKRKEDILNSFLIDQLIDLVFVSQGRFTTVQWYELRHLALRCLYHMAIASIGLEKLSIQKLVKLAEEIIEKINFLLKKTVHNHADNMLHYIFNLLYFIIGQYPNSMNEQNHSLFIKLVTKANDTIDENMTGKKNTNLYDLCS
ncbi:uncharacterized protein RHIMIDRAFT_241772 [Rhizopus microsporus ATCC 52813]|uniref:Uncharacterized protein n=1 Tax=Rhizopus microsporus ATCC 52813 TaxID=1340429 RepID=A0A2G4SHM2_RHIZD|nr:uncharacterized protein RHIMIDRAFT_241772 [Rhizopus microsporus ATCC 52813]PHZ08261.1 hypothetical protein RHIMIDRAFT_241772 [Rhizopus microsporus ATCC 52813]